MFLYFDPSQGMTAPVQVNRGATGYDLLAAENVTIPAGDVVSVRTKHRIDLSDTGGALVCPRSGLARKKVTVFNAPGVIDPDYTGVIEVVLFNAGGDVYTVAAGDRIAQLVFVDTWEVDFVPALTVHDGWKGRSGRGEAGFGSTGV